MKQLYPLVSVIIPVYNAEKYLVRCIQSALDQTYPDLEIILVDDGSTDSSTSICRRFYFNFSKIKYIRKENGGLSSARNCGIREAKGKYLFFLDADDYLHCQGMETLVRIAEESGAEITVGSHFKFRDSSLSAQLLALEKFNSKLPYGTWSGKDAARRMLLQKKIPDNSAWGKLYLKSLFQTFSFRENTTYEDLDIIPFMAFSCRQVAFTLRKIYFYRQHPDSYLHNFSSQRKDVLSVTERIENHFAEYIKMKKAAQSRRFSACFNILLLYYKNKGVVEEKEWKNTVELCRREIKRLRMGILINPNARLKNKAGALLSFLSC